MIKFKFTTHFNDGSVVARDVELESSRRVLEFREWLMDVLPGASKIDITMSSSAMHEDRAVDISENHRAAFQASENQQWNLRASLEALHKANEDMARHIQAMKAENARMEANLPPETSCEAAEEDSIPLVKPTYWVRILDAYGERKLPCEDVPSVRWAISTRYEGTGFYEVTDGGGNKVSDLG